MSTSILPSSHTSSNNISSQHPFEIIYDSNISHIRSPSTQWHNQLNYNEIEKNIHEKTTPKQNYTTGFAQPPMLTKLDSFSISRNSTMRNRKKLKKKRTVKRQRSLKFKSVSNFKDRFEFLQFLKLANYEKLVNGLLPSRMKVFKYTKLLNPIPKLTYEVVKFGSIKKKGHRYNTSQIDFMEIIYQKYKETIFNQSYKIPPNFEHLFPKDSKLLNKRELNQLNTKLLFEVLLRRTLAAKMEYRLKQNNHTFSNSSSSSSNSSSTNSNNSNEDLSNDNIFQDLIIPSPKRTRTNSDSNLENRFINDFNKIYNERYNKKQQQQENVDFYLLQPHNRSQNTITSTDEEITIKRKSQSTSNTSIFADLDCVSDELNLFITHSDKKFKSKNIIPKEIINPTDLIDNFNNNNNKRTIKFNVNSFNDEKEIKVFDQGSMKSNKASIIETDSTRNSLNSVSRFKSYKRRSMMI
ncbi:unnamed protein product [Candida verbasci]|uniref:Uncharacterized protein n=1 Tax=Candida verbasci TaxID=1227364 RepID=A0A9W4TQT5_9ASCO|nr:unnamed protein product [Candida verbasci]